MLIINFDHDDDVRFSYLILATLNQQWAYQPDNAVEDTEHYIRSYNRYARSIDLHQNKDRSSDGEFFFPIADLTDIEEL